MCDSQDSAHHRHPHPAELLLDEGHQARRVARRAPTFDAQRIDRLHGGPYALGTRLFLRHGNLTDGTRRIGLLDNARSDEAYHCRRRPHRRQAAPGRFPAAAER